MLETVGLVFGDVGRVVLTLSSFSTPWLIIVVSTLEMNVKSEETVGSIFVSILETEK